MFFEEEEYENVYNPAEEEALFESPNIPDVEYDYNIPQSQLPYVSPSHLDQMYSDFQSPRSSGHNSLVIDDDSTNNVFEEDSQSVEIDQYDDSIAYSDSVGASRQFLHDIFGPSLSTFRNGGIFGLIVLRLEDFALLRNDNRSNRTFPHILILPNQDFIMNHPDYTDALNHFYS